MSSAPIVRRGRAAAALLTCALACCGLVACGGTDNSGAQQPKTAAPLSLSVGLPVAATVSTEVWLAKSKGFFTKHNVDVSVTNAGSTASTEAAAGRIDITQQGCSGPLAPAASGHQTSIIFWMVGNVNASVQVGNGSSLKALGSTANTVMELAGKRVAVQGVGGGAYGEANALNAYITSHGGKPLTIVSLSSAGAISAQLISGQIDAAVGAADEVAGAIAAGKVRIILDAGDPVLKQISGGDIAGVCLWGLRSQLRGKAAAVAAFVAGMRDAYQYVSTTPAPQLAADLHSIKDFGSLTIADIEQSLRYDLPFMTSSAGFLSEDVWTNTLKAFGGWGLHQNLSDPRFSYGDIVDMSYWNAASALRPH
jgi:ABC-type nitrate/sulfonate/bicarbonate transport system substrate-binding protein